MRKERDASPKTVPAVACAHTVNAGRPKGPSWTCLVGWAPFSPLVSVVHGSKQESSSANTTPQTTRRHLSLGSAFEVDEPLVVQSSYRTIRCRRILSTGPYCNVLEQRLIPGSSLQHQQRLPILVSRNSRTLTRNVALLSAFKADSRTFVDYMAFLATPETPGRRTQLSRVCALHAFY